MEIVNQAVEAAITETEAQLDILRILRKVSPARRREVLLGVEQILEDNDPAPEELPSPRPGLKEIA